MHASFAEEIIAHYLSDKKVSESVNMEDLSKMISYSSCAELETILNEAAIYAAKEDRKYVVQNDIKRAFVKVGIGAEKRSKVISDKEKKITAYHEAGHAVLFHVLPEVGPVYSISIIPTGLGAAGYTMPLPEKDEMFMTKGRMMNDIVVDLGGRVAEEMFFDDITTGASHDLKVATKEARKMVTKYGMSDTVGIVSYDDDDDEVFIGRDLAHARSHSEETAGTIDAEVKRIMSECHEKARKLISEHKEALIRIAEELLKREKLSRDEFEKLFDGEVLVGSENA